jgi:hypothetical protein
VTQDSREYRDISGDSFSIRFEIVDLRKNVQSPFYNVTVTIWIFYFRFWVLTCFDRFDLVDNFYSTKSITLLECT